MYLITLVPACTYSVRRRVCIEYNQLGDCVESMGQCRNPDNTLYKDVFLPLIGGVHFCLLSYAAWVAYCVRNVDTDFHVCFFPDQCCHYSCCELLQEGQWIALSILSNMQVFSLQLSYFHDSHPSIQGIFFDVVMTWKTSASPIIYFYSRATILFILNCGIISFVFFPKVGWLSSSSWCV